MVKLAAEGPVLYVRVTEEIEEGLARIRAQLSRDRMGEPVTKAEAVRAVLLEAIRRGGLAGAGDFVPPVTRKRGARS